MEKSGCTLNLGPVWIAGKKITDSCKIPVWFLWNSCVPKRSLILLLHRGEITRAGSCLSKIDEQNFSLEASTICWWYKPFQGRIISTKWSLCLKKYHHFYQEVEKWAYLDWNKFSTVSGPVCFQPRQFCLALHGLLGIGWRLLSGRLWTKQQTLCLSHALISHIMISPFILWKSLVKCYHVPSPTYTTVANSL
jgi:hypothetical protein